MTRDARVARELPYHPTLKIVRRLHGPAAAGAVLALVIWGSGRQGNLGKLTANKLAAVVDWDGEADELLQWLEEDEVIKRNDDGTYQLVDWREFYPHESNAKLRSETARENVRKRWERERDKPAPEPLELAPPEPKPKRTAKRHDGPTVEQIVDEYRRILPDNPPVNMIGGATRAAINTRMRESAERRDLGWWTDYFTYASKRFHLTGRGWNGSGVTDDRGPFFASLAWLVGPKNMEKVVNGFYPGED